MINFLELDKNEFNNAKGKNSFIPTSDGEWVCYVDQSVTTKEEIQTIMEENVFLYEYDTIVFGSEFPNGEVGVIDLLQYPYGVIYSICFRRKMLQETGCYNRFLEAGNNFEFLLRLVRKGSLYMVTCSAEKELEISAVTLAYVVRKYMRLLKGCGKLDEIFLQYVKLSERLGIAEEFNQNMNLFLTDAAAFDRIEADTAPFLVFVGDNVCAGVLSGFAKSLAEALVSLGQAVITTDGRFGNYDEIPTDVLLSQNYKAIIGFQAPALGKESFQKMKGKKVQFWLDNPIFFDGFFDVDPEQNYFLCQDAYYADFIREHYNMSHSFQFPPGGTIVKNLPCEKKYDLVFVGNYEPLSEGIYEDEFEQGFFDYMKQHPNNTFEQGLYAYGKEQGVEYGRSEFLQQLYKLRHVCLDVLHRDRHCIFEKILTAGIQIHVYSEKWELYQGSGKENLVIHPEIYGDEPFRIWSQAKIGLSLMRGHKAGMTERVANIMLCGTCCLSEGSEYLRTYFADGEDIVLFDRSRLEELPDKISYLLNHDEERERIAMAGHEKALVEHTWKKRADQLLEILS